MGFCTRCGARAGAGDAFCRACGAGLAPPPPPPAAEPLAPAPAGGTAEGPVAPAAPAEEASPGRGWLPRASGAATLLALVAAGIAVALHTAAPVTRALEFWVVDLAVPAGDVCAADGPTGSPLQRAVVTIADGDGSVIGSEMVLGDGIHAAENFETGRPSCTWLVEFAAIPDSTGYTYSVTPVDGETFSSRFTYDGEPENLWGTGVEIDRPH